MGMFDYLRCESEVPGLGVPEGVTFQTKSVYRSLARLTISRAGRLLHSTPQSEAELDTRPARDLEFHGDLLFCGDVPGKGFGQFVARFTDGQLMWIRPLSELAEQQRLLVLRSD